MFSTVAQRAHLALLLSILAAQGQVHGSVGQPSEQEEQQPLAGQLQLPKGDTGAGHSLKLGEKIALDHLGPVVVNEDGTLRRITNWDSLTPEEQATALRRIRRRNSERLKTLEEATHSTADTSASDPNSELSIPEEAEAPVPVSEEDPASTHTGSAEL